MPDDPLFEPPYQHRNLPFTIDDWITYAEMQRCPYHPFSRAAAQWIADDDRRLLCLSLDRYAAYLVS